jgi:integrase
LDFFRKTVGTLLDQERDLETASDQLGHAGTAITKRHHVQARIKTTDAADVLQALGAHSTPPPERDTAAPI